MRKLALALLAFFITTTAYALPLGNPWESRLMTDGLFLEGNCPHFCEPCVWNIRVGFYGDYVWDRVMELDESDEHATVRKTQLWTNAGYVALNLWDWLDIFGTFGATQIEINTPSRLFGSQFNTLMTIQTETDFSWSVGVRGMIWECGSLGVGAEAQYFQTRPDINFIRFLGSDNSYHNEVLKYCEWQVGIGAAYRINIASCATAAIPYLGLRWGRARIDMDDLQEPITASIPLTLFDLRSKKDLGYAFGVTLLGCNKISVTAEARFSNEKALYVNGQFRY